jgi:hypothetical protein
MIFILFEPTNITRVPRPAPVYRHHLAPASMHPEISSPSWSRSSRVYGVVERYTSSLFAMMAAIVRCVASAMAIAFPNGASQKNTQHKSRIQVRSIITPLEFGDPLIEQVPETLTDVTSPSITSNFSLLLDLPIEIQIEIIELLQCDWQGRLAGQQQTNPLKSLRLTCKQLEALSNPVFAKFICIRAFNRSALELRKEFASKFAKYLKAMVCYISEQAGAKELSIQSESTLTTILEQAVHLQKISLYYESTDTRAHSQLLSAISRLSALEEVRIREFDYPPYPPPHDIVQSTFHHRLLNHILDHHSQRLRVLEVRGRTALHESTFLKLRDTASRLRKLDLIQCLTIETRGAFEDPKIWACAGCLEYLCIRHCTIHPATITRHIGAGVFGPLRIFYIIGCNESSGDPPKSASTVWTIPPLSKVKVDQLNDLEMSGLGSIHAKEVHMRMVPSGRSLCIEAFRRSTTFPEVAELHVEDDWDDKDFEELKRSCAMRGLTKVERDLYTWPTILD